MAANQSVHLAQIRSILYIFAANFMFALVSDVVRGCAMFGRWEYFVVAIACLVPALGCASKTSFGVWKPASTDINGLERIVVLDFEGPGESGKAVRSALTAQLKENRYYTVVDSQELQRVRPITLPDGAPDVVAALDVSRHLGIDAVVAGQVITYKATNDKTTRFNFSLGGGDTSNGDGTDGFARHATVGIAFKVIDVPTGMIRAAEQTSHNFNGQAITNPLKLPARDKVLADLTAKCTREIEAKISPHLEPHEVELARQYYGRGLSDLNLGNSLAKQKKWAEAETAWEAALKASHQNHAAMYNLALAAEARGDYATATRRVEQAINEFGDPVYHSFRKHLEASRKTHDMAMSQVQIKNQLIASRQSMGQAQPVSFNGVPPGPQFGGQQFAGPQFVPPQSAAPPGNFVPPQGPQSPAWQGPPQGASQGPVSGFAQQQQSSAYGEPPANGPGFAPGPSFAPQASPYGNGNQPTPPPFGPDVGNEPLPANGSVSHLPPPPRS